MRETGRVVSARGARAEVEMEARGECEHCGAHGICNWTGTNVRKILAVNKAGAKPGDSVALEITEGTGLKSNLLVFGIPALGMLAGVLVGGLLINDLWSGILGGIGLVVGVGIVKLIDISVGRSGKSLPVIVRRIDRDEYKGANSEQVAGSDSGSCGDDQRRG
jgi:positive regulator of sigma E activity